MTPRFLTLSCALSLLFGCGDPPQFEGIVQDVWGNPIQAATVRLEGVKPHAETDVSGLFTFERPKNKARLRAGKDGYIPQTVGVHFPGNEPNPRRVELKLFPEPKQTGFYGVGRKRFAPIVKQKLRTLGNEIRAFTGLPSVGEVVLPAGPPLQVIFHTTLRKEDIKRMDLQLHRLKFINESELSSVEGPKSTRINLWVADTAQKFELSSLPGEHDYLIKIADKLEKGVYAFHSGGVLTSNDVMVLSHVPDEHKIAYPFEIK